MILPSERAFTWRSTTSSSPTRRSTVTEARSMSSGQDSTGRCRIRDRNWTPGPRRDYFCTVIVISSTSRSGRAVTTGYENGCGSAKTIPPK